MKSIHLLLILLLAAIMPLRAKAQVYETVTTTEDFEYVTGIPENGLPTVMPNGWDRISNFPQHNFLPGVTNNLFGSDPNNILNLIGDKYLFLGSSGAGPLNLLILPHYYRASHISFLAWTDEVENMYNVDQDFHSDQGYLQMGYITNINDASTFVPLQTEIRPMVGSKIEELSQATYSYSLSNIPDNARLAFKWINEIQSDPSDVSFTLIDNVTVAHDVPKTHIANTATSTAMTWAQFAQNVSSGINYEGQTVYLDSDVTATTMVGTNENNCFKGTFEGNNHTLTFNYTATEQYTAPFRYLNGATIRNLKVNGTITTSVDRCAGLAGHCFGNNTITNCWSDITINSSKSGDGSHGGLVSIVRTGSTTFEGCTFTGQLLGSSTNRCGGLAGCTVTSAVFNNCVFDPTEITIKRDNSASFSRKFDDNAVVTVDNCYYTYDFNDGTNYVGQGKQRYTITGQNPVSIVINGTATNHNVSHITAYSGTPGLLYNSTIIAGEGDQVRLNLNGGGTYFAIHGTLTGSYNPHTLTMEASNTVIGVNRTHIANTSTSTTMTWDEFAYNVNNGITYEGVTVYLNEDINATTMVGTNENNCFKGTLEGNNHTLTFNYTATAWYTAPFSYLNGATIRNLKVDGTITANSARCSGLAGHCYGNTTITNCWSDITINSSLTSAGFYGGFVSVVRTGTTTLEGCTFTGRFLGSTHRCGGLVGSTVTVVVFNNCVFDPTEITIGLENCASFSTKYDDDNSVVTVNNSYYTSAFNDGTNYVNQGKQRYTITAVSPVTVAMNGTATNYDASHITAYSDNPGLLYNGTIITGEGEQVSLNLNGGGNSYLIDHGILTGDSNPRTLTMEAYNTVIGLNKTHIANSSTSTAMTWDEFAQYVNNGMTYYGTTLYLDEDITATTMAGTNETNCFQGTFDGQGHTLTFNYTATAWYTAPFSYLNGATIQNLKVDGTITTNAARCGGLAGHCYGKNTITNCVSDITINSLINSDGTYGGFVSIVRTDTTTFEGCAFTGRLLGSGTYKSGGLVGSTVTAVVFNNCVFAPTEVTIGLNGSATFSRKFYPDSSVISINNSYYIYDFNDGTTHVGQGKQRYTVTGQNPVSVAMNGTATNYNVSHITTYSDNPGLLYNGTIFAGSGEQVSLNLSGGDDDAYITDHGTLTGTTNPYTLTMWADNTVIMKAPEEFQVIGEQSAYTAYNIFPGYNGYCYKVFIYRPEDAEFLNYDFDISSIAFDVTQSRTSIAELALWVKDVDADYIMYGYQNFAYFIDGATQVYDTQTTFDLTTGWHTFAFNSTVPHEGGKALLVAMRGVSSNVAGNSATSSSNNVRITSKQRASWSLGANNTDPGYNSNTGAQSELRANIRLGIDYTGATCFSPTNLFVTYPDCVDTEVNLGWTENGEATTWEICLNGDENNLITTNSNPFTLTGLTPNATYTAKVRAVCGDDLRSQWSESVSFEPTIKTVVGIYETGSPQLPTTINSIYSLSQQIYTPAELGDAGTIISIDFFNGESGEATRNLEIYMKHTDWEDFNTWNHVEPTDLVFSGTVSFASQAWTTITLDTPFAYDGEQNVVITVDDNTGSAASGFYHFLCFYTTDQSYQSITYYGDENYDPTFTYSQGYTTRGKYKNQIRLVKIPQAPVVMVVNFSSSKVTLSWTDPAPSTTCNTTTPIAWQICLNGDESNLIDVTENPYTLTGLTQNATYTAKVRSIYDEGHTPWSNEVSFIPHDGFTVYYRESFDSYTNVNTNMLYNTDTTLLIHTLPEGWTSINSDSLLPFYKHMPTIVRWVNIMGDVWVSPFNSLWFVDLLGHGMYAIMPPMNTAGKQVTMYACDYGNFTVGLMTDPTDVNTFTACSPTYVRQSDNMPPQLIQCTLTGQGNYIAIKFCDGIGFIDNVVVHDYAPITVPDSTLAIADLPISYRLPFYNEYSSTSHQIYTPDELGEAGVIKSIGFLKTDTVSASLNLSVYMVNTDLQDCTHSFPYNIDDRVFSGRVDFHGIGWHNIPLDIPFPYDGEHNIGLVVNLGVPSNEKMDFQCITTASPQADNGTQYYYQKNILMYTKDPPVNVCTNLTASTRYSSADLSWNGVEGAQSYTVRYVPAEAVGAPVFTEGFEDGMGNWTLRDAYESTGIKAVAHSGSCCFGFEGYWNQTQFQYLISPRLPNLSEDSMLELYYCVDHRDNYLSMDLGISLTDDQISSFYWMSTLGTNSQDWIRYYETIPAETKYICLRCTNTTNRCLRIDDISVLNPAEWQTATTATTSLQLTGLDMGTEYKAQVRSNLPNELWSHITRFTTQDAPTGLQCTSVSLSSANLGWADDYTPEVWQICINGNENNLIEVTEKQYTLTNLTPMTSYTAKVRGRTGAELSEWSNESVINTAQEPVSLPYSTDFETASDWYLINGDLTNAWVWGEAAHHGEGTHGLYISNDGGTSHSYDDTSAATVYAVKAFNFEAGIYKFTFDWIAYGKNGDAMNVFLVPADQNLVAEPWGTIGAGGWIYVGPYGLYYGSTEWQTAINEVPISSGTYYLAFIWQNDSRYGDNPPAAIDNLSIALCECPKPVNLYFNVAEQTNTAELSWTEMGEATQWQICLDGDEDNLIDVSTNPYSLTGLAFESWHSVKVRANCGESQSDWSSTVNFEVTQKILIGRPLTYHNRIPFDNLYNYSLTQQLYSSEELGYAGLITSIDFRKDTDKECVRNLDIYMVHTDKSSFVSTTDWIQVTDADLVFSGTVNFVSNDWTTITLDTPFNYDGQHNVALIVDDNTGSYGETIDFVCTYSPTYAAMFYYDDRTNYDPKGTPGDAKDRTTDRCHVRIMKVVNLTKEIAGYGTGNGKWHLVASPFAAPTDPTDVTNMLSNEFDLYRFNPAVELEWENWKDSITDHYHFNLESGRGYLYANNADVTLGFCGVPYNGYGKFALTYDANDEHKCWNLVGNPFNGEAYLDRPYYVLNEYGTGINPVAIPATTPIPPFTAVFVKAVADGDKAVFTRVTP